MQHKMIRAMDKSTQPVIKTIKSENNLRKENKEWKKKKHHVPLGIHKDRLNVSTRQNPHSQKKTLKRFV